MMLAALSAAMLATVPASGAMAEQSPEVRVGVERNEIYEGDSVLYQVNASPAEEASEPRIDFGADIDAQYIGARESRNMGMSIVINGRQVGSPDGSSTRSFIYRLTPRTTGAIVIPAPEVDIGGQTVRGPQVTLQVRPAEEQDLVKAWVEVNKERLYPMQECEVTLSIAVKELPAPYQGEDPVVALTSLQVGVPRVEIPWASQRMLPEGLYPLEQEDAWFDRLSYLGAGFNINGRRSMDMRSMFAADPFEMMRRDPFESMMRDDLATFLPKPVQVELPDADGLKSRYWRYDFTRRFIATRAGTLRFGPATVTGTFVEGIQDGKAVVNSLRAIAKAKDVAVVEPPQQGRPSSYTGAIGHFEADATITPTDIAVGDPFTLSFTVRGSGLLDQIAPPDLSKIPAISQHFKTYDATEDRRRGECEFTYSLRPLDTVMKAFPSVPFSYFDADTETYVTLDTPEVPMTIRPAAALDSSDIIANMPRGNGNGSSVTASAEGVFANITDVSRLRDETVRFDQWLVMMGAMAAAYAAILIGVNYHRQRSGDTAAKRRRNAADSAKKRLKQAKDLLRDPSRRTEGADAIRLTIVGLVADVNDASQETMTPKDVRARLDERSVDEATIAQAEDLLEQCEGVRYGMPIEAERIIDDAKHVLDDLLRQLKRGKHLK